MPRDHPDPPQKPYWVNAPDYGRVMRSYGSYDAVLIEEGDSIRLAITKAAKRFTVVFGAFFLPFAAWIVFSFAAPDAAIEQRGWIAAGAGVFGVFVFGLVYALFHYHERLGDYIVLDRERRRIELPRLKREFAFADAVALQRITGWSGGGNDTIISDLNLMVREGDAIVRYHVMGNPAEKHLSAIAKYVDLPIERLNIDRGSDRFYDLNSV